MLWQLLRQKLKPEEHTDFLTKVYTDKEWLCHGPKYANDPLDIL